MSKLFGTTFFLGTIGGWSLDPNNFDVLSSEIAGMLFMIGIFSLVGWAVTSESLKD